MVFTHYTANPRKVLTIGILLFLLTLVGVYADINVSKIPSDLEEKIHSRDNPSPYQNSKAVLSGVAKYALKNKDVLKIKFNPAIKISYAIALANNSFNLDSSILPKNEESLTTWTPPGSTTTVIGGAFDYRGGIGLLSGLSGYYVSADNGNSILREGALPLLSSTTNDFGINFNATSFGNPALDTYRNDGTTYYAGLYVDFSTETIAIGLAQAANTDLLNTSLSDSQIWKVANVQADNLLFILNDKPWLAVDNSGVTKNIYVTWASINSSAETIWMASCAPGMHSSPTCKITHNDTINGPVSDSQTATYPQWSKVSVDSAGRVIVTWTEYNFTNPNPPYYSKKLWYRVFAPGGITPLTPPTLIIAQAKPVDFDYALQSHQFPVPGNAWSEVGYNETTPRMIVTYTQCGGVYLFDIPSRSYADSCSHADTYLRYIDNYQLGSRPSSAIPIEVSTNKDSFFPTFSINQRANRLDIAWYQTEAIWKHDISLAQQQRNLSNLTNITIPTSLTKSLVPDNDKYIGESSIGDYIQLKTEPGNPNRVYVHYTANPIFKLPMNVENSNIGGSPQENWLTVRTY